MRLIDLDKIDWTTFPAEFLTVYADQENVRKWLSGMPKVTVFALTDSQDPGIRNLAMEARAHLMLFMKKYLECCSESVKERSEKK